MKKGLVIFLKSFNMILTSTIVMFIAYTGLTNPNVVDSPAQYICYVLVFYSLWNIAIQTGLIKRDIWENEEDVAQLFNFMIPSATIILFAMIGLISENIDGSPVQTSQRIVGAVFLLLGIANIIGMSFVLTFEKKEREEERILLEEKE